jgi:hypothetical protein
LDLAQKLLRRAAALLPAFTLPVTGAFSLLPVARLYFALPFAVSPPPCLTERFSPRPTDRFTDFFLRFAAIDQSVPVAVRSVIGQYVFARLMHKAAMHPAGVAARVTLQDELIESQVVAYPLSQLHITDTRHLKVCCLSLSVLAFNVAANSDT